LTEDVIGCAEVPDINLMLVNESLGLVKACRMDTVELVLEARLPIKVQAE
jgi:hypothetical protein